MDLFNPILGEQSNDQIDQIRARDEKIWVDMSDRRGAASWLEGALTDELKVGTLSLLCRQILEQLALGKKVLVHCFVGRNRSSTVLAALLLTIKFASASPSRARDTTLRTTVEDDLRSRTKHCLGTANQIKRVVTVTKGNVGPKTGFLKSYFWNHILDLGEQKVFQKKK